jgi:hypothetical protein
MTTKKSKTPEPDYSFINKYIKEENPSKQNPNFSIKNFEPKNKGSVEVRGNIGEGESYPNNSNSYNMEDKEDITPNNYNKKNKPVSKAKQDFIDKTNNGSLSLDTCNKLNHSWNNN